MINLNINKTGLIQFFAEKENVLTVYIFGSFGTEYYHQHSDLDFAILFTSKISLLEEMAVIAELSRIINNDQIDLVNLNTASLKIKYKVLKTGELIFEKDKSKTDDFVENTLNEYLDHVNMYQQFDKEYFRSFGEDYGNG